MGPEGALLASGSFSDKVPPSFDGHGDYSSYREDVELWVLLTSLVESKRGPALIGRLSGEPKVAAKTLGTEIISSDKGVTSILAHLDKSYALNKTMKLDNDLAEFLDFVWEPSTSVEQFIAGFHSRLDRISELNINDKLKGHLMLRKTGLDEQERNVLVGAASGKYEIAAITSALQHQYRKRENKNASLHSKNRQNDNTGCRYCKPNNPCRAHQDSSNSPDNQNVQHHPRASFISNKNLGMGSTIPSAIIDSGACASIVGKKTLDDAMRKLKLGNIPDGVPRQSYHRFGNSSKDYPTLFSVKMPFLCKSSFKNKPNGPVEFDVSFDVIDGDLPFLLGLPSLCAMKANLNFEYMNIGIRIERKSYRIPILKDDSHLFISFKSWNTNTSLYTCPPIHGYIGTNQLYRENKYTSGGKYSLVPTGNSRLGSFYNEDCEEVDVNPKTFNAKDLTKLHLQLKHGTKTAMQDWIKASKLWDPALEKSIDEVLLKCECKKASPLNPHPQVSTTIPDRKPQEEVALDIITIEGSKFLHIVDKCTGWSETALLKQKTLKHQIRVFINSQIHRHGTPTKIYGDNEYNKKEFLQFCASIRATFAPIPAYDHEANGAIESANRTLRSYFNRLRALDKKETVSNLVSEATYGKNICKGSKIASSFELLYSRKPRIMAEYSASLDSTATIEDHQAHQARNRLYKMMNRKVRFKEDIVPGDTVFFWRDKDKWVGPAPVVQVQDTVVTVSHNGKLKTSGISKVIKHKPTESIHDDDTTEEISEPEESLPAKSLSENSDISIYRKITEREPELPEETAPEPRRPVVASESIIRTRSQLRKEQENANLDSTSSQKNDFSNLADQAFPWKTSSTNPPSTKLVLGKFDSSSYFTSFITEAITLSPITPVERMTSFAKERENWVSKSAFIPVAMHSTPKSANIIGSHVVYRRKPTGIVKARIVPWGHRDIEKDYLRTDAPCLSPELFRLVISIATEKKWEQGEMDITAAFLQARGFDREIYVRPPKEESTRGVYWKLTAAAYGLVDSGRLWYLTSDSALTQKFGLSKSKLEPTLYFRIDPSAGLSFVMVSQVDNYIYCGTPEELDAFEAFLTSEFQVGELKRNNYDVMGCEIRRTKDGQCQITQSLKMGELSDTPLRSTYNDNIHKEIASAKEFTLFKSVIGKMLYIGRVCYPVMLYHASHMATKINQLKKHHLKDLAAVLRHLKERNPVLTYRSSQTNGKFTLHAFSDASAPNKKETSGRGAFLIFRRCGDIVHPIHWNSRKLRRVARSSTTAEVLAAGDAVNLLCYMQLLMEELTGKTELSSTSEIQGTAELTVDSKSTFGLITTTKEPEEKLNKVDLAIMRDAYNIGIIDAISWCPGSYHAADPLTKDNRVGAIHLHKILRDGHYPIHPESIARISPNGHSASTEITNSVGNRFIPIGTKGDVGHIQ